MKKLTDQNWIEETTKSGKVLVMFSAAWCAPCKTMTPVLEALEKKELAGKVSVCKASLEDCPSAAAQNQVKSLPTLVLFENSVVRSQLVGNAGRYQILEMLSE